MKKVVGGIFGVILVVALACQSKFSFDVSPEEVTIFEQTNVQRVKNGKPPLTMNAQLKKAARLHAQNMADRKRMSHDLPIAGMRTLSDRVRYSGYTGWRSIGENIAYNYSPDNVVQGWMNSPGHRANILGGFSEIGVGVAHDEHGEPYYCQTFGSRE